MDSLPVTNKAAGNPESATNKTLETGAAAVQVSSFSQFPSTVLLMLFRTLRL